VIGEPQYEAANQRGDADEFCAPSKPALTALHVIIHPSSDALNDRTYGSQANPATAAMPETGGKEASAGRQYSRLNQKA